MKQISKCLVLIALISAPSFADHVVGFGFGYGTQDATLKEGTTGGDNVSFDINYRYMFQPNIGVELGWSAGIGGIGSIIVDRFANVQDVTYDGFSSGVFFEYPIVDWLYLNSKVGINRYTLDYNYNNEGVDDFSVGYEALLGVEARASKGFGVNLSYKYINSSIFESNQVILGTSYRF